MRSNIHERLAQEGSVERRRASQSVFGAATVEAKHLLSSIVEAELSSVLVATNKKIHTIDLTALGWEKAQDAF
jgi:hypothetical protein